MNQTQRDQTYRLDAVKSICEQHGRESELCQQAIHIWETQHAMNVFYSQVSFIGSILGFIVLGIFLCFLILKPKTNKTSNPEAL